MSTACQPARVVDKASAQSSWQGIALHKKPLPRVTPQSRNPAPAGQGVLESCELNAALTRLVQNAFSLLEPCLKHVTKTFFSLYYFLHSKGVCVCVCAYACACVETDRQEKYIQVSHVALE